MMSRRSRKMTASSDGVRNVRHMVICARVAAAIQIVH